ncbi:NAD(P)/FAD-dependent oxidoreductase [Cellulosilyticum sp. I15G10I2]|uniref:NAD(P)/FAD-dependent oxidoreductase n=1 Tax=Cellulosilyticum sp. I15G10I2 TaxID=1892843 RepID=UPI00085C7547|nr:NAD(P)/FAD-dependent oxidoreductase [Cellulosilyticum sp. I15G10I2]
MHYNTIVIGAGPAGLFISQLLAKQNLKVLLLERNAKAGKKLLLSGSGQCNFTHAGPISHFFECYGDHAKFLKKALTTFNNKMCMDFFEKSGIAYHIYPNGKVFPKSMKSEDVLNALLVSCQLSNVDIRYNSLVEDVTVYDTIFTVETNDNKRYFSDNIVIATGGKSYPKTGSDGIGYSLAQRLGHGIVEPRPALTDVRVKDKSFVGLSGLSFEQVEITIWHNHKKVIAYQDGLLFTHKGLSGPAILNTSRWMRKGDCITINFLYPKTYEEVKAFFTNHLSESGKEELITFLKRLNLPKSFCVTVCNHLQADPHILCAKLPRKMREEIVQYFTKFPFEVEAVGGFHMAMATSGGVWLKEVNPSTMESRKQKGLYFVGEVLDIDGNTGGYNIQAAFSTAYLCAESIKEKTKK